MEQRAPTTWFRHRLFLRVLPTLLAALVLLPLLGHRALTAWDEGIYAEISREMVHGHSLGAWWVPHWNGQLWFEKPPLAMWLTALSMRVFGVTTWAARLPSALAGIALVTVVSEWLRRRYGGVAALVGALLLLSGFGFQHAARAGETDTLLSLCCFCAMAGLAGVLEADPRGWLLFWTGFAFAVMTKGAAAITLPLTACGLVLWERRHLLRFARAFWLGGLLFCGLVLPWHLSLWMRFGQDFVREYLGLHVLGRATGALEGHSTAPWFFVWVLLISFFPAALVLPWSFPAALRGQSRERAASLRPFAVFALLTLLLFSAARTRLPHYIDPLYAPLAALTAVWLAQRAEAWVNGAPRRVVVIAAGWIILYAAGAALTAPARRALHSSQLPGGRMTPDSRETAALLQQGAPLIRQIPGRLLLWRSDPETPMTIAAFYGQHLVQQVTLGDTLAGEARERYTFSPVPLRSAAGSLPQPILLDCALIPALPAPLGLRTLAAGPDQLLAILEPFAAERPVREVLCPRRANFGDK